MSTTHAPSPANEEMAAAIFADGKERKEQERAERSKAERDKQAILSAVESETCHVRLAGRRIEFTLLSGAEEDYIEGTLIELLDVEEEEMTGEEFALYRESKSEMLDLLDEHAVEDAYDRAFFERLPQSKRNVMIANLRQGGIEGTRAGN